MTWSGRQLAAREETPAAFLAALRAADLPGLNEPGDEHRTLHWLYARSTQHLDDTARRVLAAAGALAHSSFALAAASTALGDETQDRSQTEAAARSALKQLVRHGLLRLSSLEADQWEFTHALAYQFARAAADAAPLAALGEWAQAEIADCIDTFKQSADAAPLENALRHAGALLRADRHAQALAPLASALRYDLHDTIAVLGRLDFVRTALQPVHDWLLAAPAPQRGANDWQREISVSYNKLGNVFVAAGQLEPARKAFEQGLAIRERLAKADPSNSQWQRDLSVSYNKLGNVFVAAGQLEPARNAFEQSLSIAERLAKADPSNSQWQRDLSWSYSKRAEMDGRAGEKGAALEWAKKSLAIAERLAKLDPLNATWQKDVRVSRGMVKRLGGE